MAAVAVTVVLEHLGGLAWRRDYLTRYPAWRCATQAVAIWRAERCLRVIE